MRRGHLYRWWLLASGVIAVGAFDAFLKQITEGAIKLGKPVLFIHGDTHIYRVDKPFRNVRNEKINNLTRLETYGSPMVGWVRVTVDQNDPALFRIEPGGTLSQ